MGRRSNLAIALDGASLQDLQALLRAKEQEVQNLAERRAVLADELADVDAQMRSIGGVGAPIRRGPGRPKGTRGPGRPPKVAAKAKRGRPAKASTTGKRGPGRPRKTETIAASGPAPVKRGPGRPRKVETKAKRGRPVKQKATPAASAPPKDHAPLYAAIRAAMTGAEPMKAGDLAKKVVAGGFVTTNKAFHLEVGRRLAEMPEVAKSDAGTYALKA
jgi:hypothetical protein